MRMDVFKLFLISFINYKTIKKSINKINHVLKFKTRIFIVFFPVKEIKDNEKNIYNLLSHSAVKILQ